MADVTCKLCVTVQTLSPNALSASALRSKSYAFLYSKDHKSLKFIDNRLAETRGLLSDQCYCISDLLPWTLSLYEGY